MAITAGSSANHSSTLPTISFSYYNPAKSCHQVFNTLHLPATFSSSKHGLKSVPEVTFATSTATREAVTLPIDAAESARTAVATAFKIENFLDFRETEKVDEEKTWRNEVLMRRRRRRKRRKASSESLENEKVIQNMSLKPANSGQYLTPKQEAEYTFCLKVCSAFTA